MYNNEPIDEYIRSVLGYPSASSPNMYMDNYNMPFNNMRNDMVNSAEMENLEDCYPEIYKIVYPMITQRCSQNMEIPTRELVDSLTDEIYTALEVNNEVSLNINIQNEMSENRTVQTTNNKVENAKTKVTASQKETIQENRGEDRQIIRNRGLNDLIKILIIRELLRKTRK